MRVLIAIDGSQGGFEAVKQAAALLSPTQDQIVLYYSPPRMKNGAGTLEENFRDRAAGALANACFDEAKALLPSALSSITETYVGEDPPARDIPIAAKAWNANLIVVGARGLGPIKRLLLGSVSRAVVHSAEVPVLIVRPRRLPESPLKVLLACENAQGVARAGQVLQQFTWPAHSQGRLMSVIDPMFAGEIPKWLEERARSADAEAMSRAWVLEHEAELKTKTTEMSDCLTLLPAPFQGQPPLIVEGHPGDRILESAIQEAAELIVVGTRHLGGISRLLLGSTSQAVLAHASCSVLVIPQPEAT